MSALTIAKPSADTDIRIAWDDLMSAYEAAKIAGEEVNRRYDAACAAYEAEKPAEPEIDMVLLLGFLMGHDNVVRARLFHHQDLDELEQQIIAAKGVTLWERVDRNPERIAEIAKVREYRRLRCECEERHGISALDDEWTEAGGRLADARDDLILAPAPDYTAVRWKLDQLFGPAAVGPVSDEGRGIPCWDCELTDAIIADMARLGGAK